MSSKPVLWELRHCGEPIQQWDVYEVWSAFHDDRVLYVAQLKRNGPYEGSISIPSGGYVSFGAFKDRIEACRYVEAIARAMDPIGSKLMKTVQQKTKHYEKLAKRSQAK